MLLAFYALGDAVRKQNCQGARLALSGQKKQGGSPFYLTHAAALPVATKTAGTLRDGA
jgi:hypothetical protein